MMHHTIARAAEVPLRDCCITSLGSRGRSRDRTLRTRARIVHHGIIIRNSCEQSAPWCPSSWGYVQKWDQTLGGSVRHTSSIHSGHIVEGHRWMEALCPRHNVSTEHPVCRRKVSPQSGAIIRKPFILEAFDELVKRSTAENIRCSTNYSNGRHFIAQYNAARQVLSGTAHATRSFVGNGGRGRNSILRRKRFHGVPSFITLCVVCKIRVGILKDKGTVPICTIWFLTLRQFRLNA